MLKEIFRFLRNFIIFAFIIAFIVLNNIALGQVTSISQIVDISQSDFAFADIQSLIERYRCITSYPDVTFRGKRAITRFELVHMISSCIERNVELISTVTANSASLDEIKALERLQQKLKPELEFSKTRVDVLEEKIAKLESGR